MKNLLPENFDWTIVATIILGLGFGGVILYVNYRHVAVEKMEAEITSLEGTVEKLERTVSELGGIFFSTLTEEQKKNEDLMDKFEDITDSVEDLEKLSETDPELLRKYSKVYFLNEHYVPVSLTNIGEEYVNSQGTNLEIHSDVLSYLEEMMDSAKEDDLSLQVLSAFRSFGTQSELKASYTFTYGSGTANSFSADQGYSEHQLGTAVDFTTVALGGALLGFDTTPEYRWLLDNAHRYGFVLSYPAGNSYYKFEPWHWRFVGTALSRRLHDEDKHFYDLDQREIDKYLQNFFD